MQNEPRNTAIGRKTSAQCPAYDYKKHAKKASKGGEVGGRLGDVCSGGGGRLEVVVDPHAPQGDARRKSRSS